MMYFHIMIIIKRSGTKNKGKQFFNNYPQKSKYYKTHYVFEKNKQIAQINVIFINTRFDSLVMQFKPVVGICIKVLMVI